MSTRARILPPCASGWPRTAPARSGLGRCSERLNTRTSSRSQLPPERRPLMASLSAYALGGIPEVHAGDDLAALILAAFDEDRRRSGRRPRGGQVIAIAHTVVSKAEGAVVRLSSVTPSEDALRLAAEQGKDPRAVQVVLDESSEVLRAEHGVLISRTRHGFVCANAGVDASNAARESDGETLMVLPRDPDESARRIRAGLGGSTEGEDGGDRAAATALAPAVLITDSFGRAWRHGQLDVVIGCAGMQPLDDWRGRTDANGMPLTAPWRAVADGAAGAADLARSKDSREPVVVIDGLERFVTAEDGPGAAALLRPLEEDLFR